MSELPELNTLLSANAALGGIKDRVVTGVDFDFNGTGNIVVGSMVMEFYTVDDATLALADSDEEAFIEAASDFYYDATTKDYFADDDALFAAFSAAFHNVASSDTVLNMAIKKMADICDELSYKETMIPSALYNGAGLVVNDSSSYAGTDLADKSVLGEKYATYTLTGGDAVDTVDRIVFTFKNEGTAYRIGQIKDFTVYVKSTSNNATRPFFCFVGGPFGKFNNASFYNLTSDRWMKLKMSEISSYEGLWSSTALGAVNDRVFTNIDFDFSGTGDIVIGSIDIEFSAIDMETLSLRSTDSSLFVAKLMAFCEEATANGSFGENNAQFNALKNAISELENIEGGEELLALAKIKKAWLSLDNSNSYPDFNTNNWNLADWISAANRVDTSNSTNTAEFIAALQDAIAVRDKLNIEISCNEFSYSTVSDADEHTSALTNNLMSGLTPAVYYFNGTDRVEVADIDCKNLTDGDFETATTIATENSGVGAYVELIYQYEGMVDIDNILVVSSALESLKKYRIYVANTIDKIEDVNSIVAAYDNENGDRVQIFNFDAYNKMSGTYVAIRVYTDGNSVSIDELGIFGELLRFSVTKGSFSNEQLESLGDNLLAMPTTVPYIKTGSGAKTKWSAANLGYPLTNLTDCDNDTVVGFGGRGVVKSEGEEVTFHIFFDLKETYYIKKLLINHFKQPYLQTGKYEIYASTDYSTLFRSTSKILSYNNMSDSENGTTEAQIFSALGDGVIARYVSFCIKVPVSDYEKALSTYPGLCYIRLNDLAVYGERYYKPLKEINFLGHMPVEIYRSDDGGNKQTVSEQEYDGIDYLNAADGLYDVATPIAQNGKNLDFVFNLCANKSINAIKLNTLTKNVKGLKVYASDDEAGVWSSDSVVLDYYDVNADSSVISRTFAEAPIYARYIRFSITDTVSGVFDPTEFEVVGWNTQEFLYINLAEEKSDNASIWLEDKDTYTFDITSNQVGKYNAPWNGEDYYDFMYAFDGDPQSIADLYNGSRGNADGSGRVTINILVDLCALTAVDNINFKSGGTEDYWPSEINFYLGADDLSLFGKDAKPIKQFTSKTDDAEGNYSYTFLPQVAQYVRIEIVEGTQRYFEHINKIGVVISEIQVNGLEIVGYTASEGIAASVTDSETGIRADIVALRDNDVYSALQDILVIKRDATEEEKLVLKEQGVAFASEIYDIYLLDSNGNIISDVGGREIRVCMPKTLFEGTGEAYIVRNSYGEPEMVEHTVEDNYYITILDEAYGMSFAFCEFVNFVEDEEQETPTDMDNTLTEEDDESEPEDTADDEDDEDDEDNPKRKKKIKVVRKNNSDDFDYLWLIITAGAVVVVLAAGITIFLILKKKKQKQEE